MLNKRVFCCFLALIMLFAASACGKAQTNIGDDSQVLTTADNVPQATDTADTTTSIPEETEAPIVITEKTLILARNNVSDYVIIRPENATESVLTAACELQSYIKRISGVEISIKTDAEPSRELELVVGYTNRSAEGQFDTAKLGDEGFVIETVGKKLYIGGSGVRGALYGVYAFLEQYLGCRFYTSEYEKIPIRETLVVQPIERDEQIPVFEYREIDFVTSRKNNFQAKLKLNGRYGIADEKYGGRVEYRGGFVHTLNNIFPADKYYNEHPEYWALKEDGTRQKEWGVQLCLSNPDVLAITIEHVRNILKDNPDASIISISQNDSTNWQLPCQCETCKKIYEEEGAYSGGVIRFVNAVAKEFADQYPNLKFDTLAYKYSRSVCKTAPAANVIVRLCTIECCFSHPLDECPDVMTTAYATKSIAEDIADWGKITDNIYVWDYVTNFAYPVTIFPNFNTLLPNARFFAEHNVVGVYEEGNYFAETGDFSDLRSYIMAKILWDPYMSEQEYWAYIDDFLKGVYGAGWTYIREYIDLAQQLVRDKHFSIYSVTHEELYPTSLKKDFSRPLPEDITLETMRNYTETDWSKYYEYYITVEDNPLVSKGTELFEAAMTLATPEQQDRIVKARLQLDFLRSYAMYERADKALNNVEKIVDNFMFSSKASSLELGEKQNIIREISNLVKERLKTEYAEYNEQLCLTMLKYCDNFMLKEGQARITRENYTQLDFSKAPKDWWS